MWSNLTPAEQDEYYGLIRDITSWSAYCETQRNNREAGKKKPLPIDSSLDVPTAGYLRWDELTSKFWSMKKS